DLSFTFLHPPDQEFAVLTSRYARRTRANRPHLVSETPPFQSRATLGVPMHVVASDARSLAHGPLKRAGAPSQKSRRPQTSASIICPAITPPSRRTPLRAGTSPRQRRPRWRAAAAPGAAAAHRRAPRRPRR